MKVEQLHPWVGHNIFSRDTAKKCAHLGDGEGQAEDAECGQLGVGARPLCIKEGHMEEGIASFTVF